MKIRKKVLFICVILFIALGSYSCSIEKTAMNPVSNTLNYALGGEAVDMGDSYIEVLGDAAPYLIGICESLAAKVPNHRGLQLKTGTLYVMYAFAFCHTPATMHMERSEQEYQEKKMLMKRAKKLYLRGRDILLNALDKKYPGFFRKIKGKQDKQLLKNLLKPMDLDDIEYLYWAGIGWLSAFAIDPVDMELAVSWPKAKALMDKVLEIDHTYKNGAVHNFYILFHGAGKSGSELAREHFKKALEISGGNATSPYLALASTVTVSQKNPGEFKKLLNKVLAIEPGDDPDGRLVNAFNRKKSRWLLSHIEDFFIPVTLPGQKEVTK